jgi:Arc/MetJ-type ribon-helix-helix transcriptional regulator
MPMNVTALLRDALRTLQAERDHLTSRITAVQAALNGEPASTSPNGTAPRGRRPMSAAQRAEVGRRMKAYWAARRRQRGRKAA